MLYACASLSCFRLFRCLTPSVGLILFGYIRYPWGLVWMWPFRRHLRMLGCSVRCYAYLVCSCHPLAFYASLHACSHVHAWVLLASVSSMLQHNEVMDIQSKPTFVPRKYHLLFAFLLVCLLACLLAFLFICLPCLSYLFALSLFNMLYAPLSFHCLSVGFLSLPLHVHTWSED